MAPGTVKQTETTASVANVLVVGGAFESDRLLPQNLDLPLIEGLIVIQLALESVAELCSYKYIEYIVTKLKSIKILTSKSVNFKVTACPSVGVCTQQSSTLDDTSLGKFFEEKVLIRFAKIKQGQFNKKLKNKMKTIFMILIRNEEELAF